MPDGAEFGEEPRVAGQPFEGFGRLQSASPHGSDFRNAHGRCAGDLLLEIQQVLPDGGRREIEIDEMDTNPVACGASGVEAAQGLEDAGAEAEGCGEGVAPAIDVLLRFALPGGLVLERDVAETGPLMQDGEPLRENVEGLDYAVDLADQVDVVVRRRKREVT